MAAARFPVTALWRLPAVRRPAPGGIPARYPACFPAGASVSRWSAAWGGRKGSCLRGPLRNGGWAGIPGPRRRRPPTPSRCRPGRKNPGDWAGKCGPGRYRAARLHSPRSRGRTAGKSGRTGPQNCPFRPAAARKSPRGTLHGNHRGEGFFHRGSSPVRPQAVSTRSIPRPWAGGRNRAAQSAPGRVPGSSATGQRRARPACSH